MEQIGKSSKNVIDVDRILEGKLGARAKRIPRFVVNWLKKILHQDELNEGFRASSHLEGIDWLEWCVYDYLGIKIELEGEENLPGPDDGKLYAFVSNHPLGGPDGVALGAIVGPRYGGNICYLVNDFLMSVKPLAPFFIPINKTGAQSRNLPALVEQGFKSDKHVLMFPAGICSRRLPNGQIGDLKWGKMFITKCVSHHRDVVPVYFEGRNSRFFYNLAWFSDRFLKFNVAMLFLVDEMYKNRGKTFKVKIGMPIPWQTFDKSKTPLQWAAFVREKVYSL